MKSPTSHVSFASRAGRDGKTVVPAGEEMYLFPAHMPPKYTIFDLFPFSLLIDYFNRQGHTVKGKKASRIRAQMRNNTSSRNIPLEITLYLVSDCTMEGKVGTYLTFFQGSYIAEIQARQLCGVPTLSECLFDPGLMKLGLI